MALILFIGVALSADQEKLARLGQFVPAARFSFLFFNNLTRSSGQFVPLLEKTPSRIQN